MQKSGVEAVRTQIHEQTNSHRQKDNRNEGYSWPRRLYYKS